LNDPNGKHSTGGNKIDTGERRIVPDSQQRGEYSGDGDDDADANQSDIIEEKRIEYSGEARDEGQA
jgi:hypothetical protein